MAADPLPASAGRLLGTRMHRAALLTRALLAATLLNACHPTEPGPPCVKGVSEGDTLSATVLGLYDENTTFAYDLTTYFGTSSDPEFFRNCIPTDLVLGETLTVDVVDLGTGEDKGCNPYALSVGDTQLIETGLASGGAGWAMGWERLGAAFHRSAVVNGCERNWAGYFIVRRGGHLTDPAVAGELPPALLLRDIDPTPNRCPTSEPLNECLYAIEISKQ